MTFSGIGFYPLPMTIVASDVYNGATARVDLIVSEPNNVADCSFFWRIAIIESGGSGSHASIRRKRGVRRFNIRIWPSPNVLRRRTQAFSHHAGTPGRLKSNIFST